MPGGSRRKADHISARAITSAVLRNMREGAEEMYSHFVVPSFYQVFLHERDFVRLHPIFSRLIADAKNALDGELADLNRVRLVDKLVLGRPVKYESADREWKIELFQDPDDEQQPGTVQVRSQLLLPPKPGIREGSITRFTVTRSDDAISEVPEHGEQSVDEGCVLAEIRYVTETGDKIVKMTGPELLIGRGGPDAHVDLEIANPSVSEVHARIHHLRPTGVFFLENRGKYGTTVDGKSVPKGAEVSLGRRSRIGMANDTVFVEFVVMG